MARTIKLDLNDESEAALQWAVERHNIVRSQDKDFAPLDIEGWCQMQAALIVRQQREAAVAEKIEAIAAQMRKDAGL